MQSIETNNEIPKGIDSTSKELSFEDNLQLLIKALGSENNINSTTHCMTRLRFKLVDESLVNQDEIKKIKGVKGVVLQQGQTQVIIGVEVEKWYNAISNTSMNTSSPGVDTIEKGKLFQGVMRIVAGIFGPVVPAIAGAGMLMGLLSGLIATNVISESSDTVYFFRSISVAVFFFLPMLVSFSAAKVFKVNEYIALAVSSAMLAPKLIEKAAQLKDVGAVPELTVLGIVPIELLNYGGAIVPAILAIWVLSKVTPLVDKLVPSSAKPVFTPLLAFTVTSTITLSFVGPAGIWLSNGAGWVVGSLLEISPTLTGFVFGLTRPITIVFGIHHSMTPISLNNFALYGKDLLMPIMCLGNLAIAGATMAVWHKQRKYVSKEESSITLGSGVTAILGITEPALFGVLTKYTKALMTASLAAGVFGAISVTIDTHLNSYILSSVFSLPAYLSGGTQNFIQAILGVCGVFVLSYILTLLFVKLDDK
ncbi:PTS lactose transporter subunit IIB [Aliivibrio finisterrensis]|uniref:PTS transporter subunit EIIC n=1 Tax=Aliivibrio finisterrensis TaxID=511998 RepID=UPI00101E9102|nr:PTS transporter subunit EIIC [Aliivibrio finisterrensis]RYU68276.1 PTS lactose transporter subunit IIB [Aliivibrio finisterrensis]RYU71975.1 PTS lactose transporter subunit IIB [Aliivibrio finisterrensis]RYU75584.1 PTS lactose transporter subunit IIB [Aliivibrio finisterrensis]